MADIFNRNFSVNSILNDAAVECGLSPVADPFASTDAHFVQLRYFLSTLGRELMSSYGWQQLRKEGTFSISYGGPSTYALPADFDRFVDDTMWDRSQQEVVGGPLTSQQWQYLKAVDAANSVFDIAFRLRNDRIEIYPAPPAGVGIYATIFYEYISRGWVTDATRVDLYDAPQTGTNLVLFDDILVIKSLKLRFLGAKGFDTTDAALQVNLALANALGKGVPSETLSLTGEGCGDEASIQGVVG